MAIALGTDCLVVTLATTAASAMLIILATFFATIARLIGITARTELVLWAIISLAIAVNPARIIEVFSTAATVVVMIFLSFWSKGWRPESLSLGGLLLFV